MRRYLSRFLYIVGEARKQLLLLAFLFLVVSLTESLGIGLIGPFIGLATDPLSIERVPYFALVYNLFNFRSETEFIIAFGIVIVSVFYIKGLLMYNVQSYIFKFGFGQQAQLRCRLLSAYLSVPYVFHLKRNTALMIQNIITETDRFANWVLMPSLVCFSNISVAAALLVLLFAQDFMATSFILVLFILIFCAIYRFKSRVSSWGKIGSESEKEMIRVINHGLGGIKETKVIGCEPYFIEELSEQAKVFWQAKSSFNAFAVVPRYAIESMLGTFLVLFTIFSLLYGRTSQELVSTLSVFAMASFRLLPSVSNLMNSFNAIKHSNYVVDKLYLDLREVEEAKVNQKKIYSLPFQAPSFAAGKGLSDKLSFENEFSLERVVYTYPQAEQPALRELSLTVKKGESIGLIGKSGAGKTTLVDVILGLLEPQSGDICVDGKSVLNNIRGWQNLVAYIPQSIFLTDDTLMQNIAFGVPESEIDYLALEEAVQAAQLSELVGKLPEGIRTSVGERGIRLSGGQRQRVGIARALYHKRDILVLDEATAALDNETEKLVTEAISALSGEKTLITIAHRLSTLEKCDNIYQLDQGKIVAAGGYQDLILKGKALYSS